MSTDKTNETCYMAQIVLIKSFGVVHVIAQCQDCDWNTESYKNGQAIASRHARSKRHLVSVEVGMAGTYNGRLPLEKP